MNARGSTIWTIALCAMLGISMSADGRVSDPTDTSGSGPASGFAARQMSWITNAFNSLSRLNCKAVLFTGNKECNRLAKTGQMTGQTSVYIAGVNGPDPSDRLVVIFPDSTRQSREESHDGVVVIDPYPYANFGHLIVVFYIDYGWTTERCEKENGTVMDNGDCLWLAQNKQCKNSLQKHQRRRNTARRCEINFIPLVYSKSDRKHRQQQLACVQAHHDGRNFAPCHSLRGNAVVPAKNQMQEFVACDPLQKNTKRCETSHGTLADTNSCHAFMICDQAVILSGGWNSWSHAEHHASNTLNFYKMLKKNGFLSSKIKVFYSYGLSALRVTNGASEWTNMEGFHPAASKMAVSSHIKKLCSTADCVQSFVIYLNSPATNDGNMLLWDNDNDGMASDSERYTLAELTSDVQDCKARRLIIIADQSYSGEIVRAFRAHPKRYRDVVVYSSSRDSEYSFGDDFSRVWYQTNHTTTCTSQVFQKARRRTKQKSKPQKFVGKFASDSTIFGAPCDVSLSLTQKELSSSYMGCHRLSWRMTKPVTEPISSGASANNLQNLFPNSSTDTDSNESETELT